MASPNVHEFTSQNFSTMISDGSLVVADFWAPWCGPCRAIAPVIDKVADQYAGKVKVGKVNVDENPELATKYDISTIPRILLFKGGDKPVVEHVGTLSDAELAKLIDGHM